MYSSTTTFQPTFELTHPSQLTPNDINNEFDRCLNNNNYQRHDSIDYSRRPSYFTGLLGNSNSEASYSDHEQQTPSPFNTYEDYHHQYHHPLDTSNNNNKRRLSTLVELPHLGYHHHQNQHVAYPTNTNWMSSANTSPTPTHHQQRCNSSPMIYANPAVDMYSPQTYLNSQPYGVYHPTTTVNDNGLVMAAATTIPSDGIFRERASSSSSLSSSASDMNSSLSSVSSPSSRRTSKINVKSPLTTTKPTRSRGRRVSNSPTIAGQKVFTCKHDDCGKVFKRSEHLKRHVRSIHTLEKPFECPYQSCSKRFSRSDNLNQHIRIHRHTGKDTTHKNNGSSNNSSNATSRNNSFSNYMPTTTTTTTY